MATKRVSRETQHALHTHDTGYDKSTWQFRANGFLGAGAHPQRNNHLISLESLFLIYDTIWYSFSAYKDHGIAFLVFFKYDM